MRLEDFSLDFLKKAHTLFNVLWRLAEQLRAELSASFVVSELTPERGMLVDLGELVKAEYPLPVFFVAGLVKVGVEPRWCFAVAVVRVEDVDEKFMRDLAELGCEVFVYGFSDATVTYYAPGLDVSRAIRFMRESPDEYVQIEIRRELKKWREFLDDLRKFLALLRDYGVRLRGF